MTQKTWLNSLLIDLIALLTGTALAFAFAPFEIFPLAFVAPALLLFLWLNVSPKRAFWLGFLFGLGLFSAGVYWVYHSIHVFGGVPTMAAGFITSLLIAELSCFPALVGYFTNRYFPQPTTAKIVFAFPAIWLASEVIRSLLFTGFPWLFLGYSQTSSPLKGYAPILSVYGVTFALLLTSALLVNAYRQFKLNQYRSLYFNLLALISIWVLGALLTLIPWTRPEGQPVSISLVQGNISQSIKWSPEHLQLSLDRYENLTEGLWAKDKIIIWPEAAVPLTIQDAENYIENLDKKARASGSHLILGIPIQVPNKNAYYNAIVTLGETKQVYTKRRLVPFGEYIPTLPFVSQFFNFMDIPLANTIPGKYKQNPFVIGDVKISPSICYEITFPELINFTDSSIGILLTVTNDAWFGESSAQAQHLQMAKMRAIELGRPVVFVSNDGITAIIGPTGKIEAAAPPREIFILNSKIQAYTGTTPWMTNGTDPIYLIIIALLFVAVQSNRKLARENSKEIPETTQIFNENKK